MKLRAEILSGLTISLALIPEALAFSIIAQVNPMTGLFTCFILGLVTAILGGKPAMISGATGAVAIVIASLVINHGQEYLFTAVIGAGILQILFGIFKLSKIIDKIPPTVISGFLNGLGILIFLAQIKQIPQSSIHEQITAIILIILTITLIYTVPLITKKFPPALLALFITTTIIYLFKIKTETLGDINQIPSTIPSLHIPNVKFNLETLLIVLPYSFMIMIVGLTESLLTLKLLSKLTDKPGKPNKEAIAQGIGNTISGFFSGMGGCTFVGQSILNHSNGARTRISSITSALLLLFLVLFMTKQIAMIPMVALIGLMIYISFKTFDWNSIKTAKFNADLGIMLIVTLTTVLLHNLALAVIIGTTIHFILQKYERSKLDNNRILKH